MEIADYLLIGWWLLAAVTIIPIPFLLRKLRAVDRKTTGFGPPHGQGAGPLKLPLLTSILPRPAVWALAVSWVVLALSLVPLTWMSHWSRLTYLNLQFLLAGFGALMIWSGPLRKTKPARIFMILLGVAVLGVAGYATVADLFFPSLTVEGRVSDKIELRNKGIRYEIVVNGIVYQTIRPVYLPLRVGDRISAEAGAGSKVIFSARKL